ncbi:GNAT family N-acetyltransferase [Novosphingobium sp. FGD1]|uniref:GNAT family N-acetyltransferase n=1 Tax=Novosphingobium silvae TaxID=2692619 RepID=A0A7X4K768_9SPHN|nr:GNAT family N-acetyltransferase [Novosphingobium silvae]
MTRIVYLSEFKEAQSDAALAHFLSYACQHAPFDRLAWWEGLAEHCAMTPLLAFASNEGGMAVLPLASGSGRLTALANWYTFRFRPLVSGPRPPLDGLARALRKRAHRITLTNVPDEDGSATATQKAFRQAGWLVRREMCGINHILPVNGRSYEDYLSSRPGKVRTTLKRKSGRVRAEILTHFDEMAWAEYEAVYAQSWKPHEGSPEFLRTFAKAEGAAGRLRLGIARDALDPHGPAIAAQMWTVEGGTAFIHKLAHREAARVLSPGSVLSAAMIAHALDRDRVSLVDFGTGDDPYKRDWMEQQRPRYSLDMLKPLSPRNWPVLAKWALRSLAAGTNRG